MKFIYSYKSSDAVRHEASLEAGSNAEVFSILREQGIKPIKVWLDPVDARRRRIRRGALVCLAAAAALVVAVCGGRYWGEQTSGLENVPFASCSPLPRSQAVADIDPSEVFAHPAERFLAAFAVPGAEVKAELSDDVVADLMPALEEPTMIGEGEDGGVVELRRIVLGIKEDVLIQLDSGKDFPEIIDYLMSRQRMEKEFQDRMHGECQATRQFGEEVYKIKCNEVNQRLRTMGLKTVEAD